MDVSAQLEAQKSKFKSINVEKQVPLQFDLGLLASFDTNALEENKLKTETDNYLKTYTRDGTQLLINEIFQLPLTSVQDVGVVVELPKIVTAIPREKPLPKPNPPTRWERFAKIKGIKKNKKSKLIYDEEKGEWVPRWGYKGANDDGSNEWLVPVPDNADPFEDQFTKLREAKKVRISKNEARRRRNMDEAETGETQKLENKSKAGAKALKKTELHQQISVAKTSTASLGKFDKPIKGEPSNTKGVKRKFEPNIGDIQKEKEARLNILNKIIDKKGEVLNVRKAIAKNHQEN
ncbi:RRS1-domain-containing protein [Gigaspora margarita]|uniref:Ribosome biogenesis regulatory protein n=1 Tax=Gigaspora margarita TaxID=4874 RepID=A0A8H3WVE1_GIGMA|nr:RRS1-domain-containing protein [Gigaspora margarita]